jgi:hypothetical protein
MGDCSVDIALRDVLAIVEAVLEKGRTSAQASGLTTLAAVPSSAEAETASSALQGGPFLATYSLAQQGGLKYNANVVFESPVTGCHTASDAELLVQIEEATRDELDCRVCLEIFYEPITTPCGHTLCRSCLQKAMDGARDCPTCRGSLSIRPAVYPSNQVLSGMASYFSRGLVEKRRQAVADDARNAENKTSNRPIFVSHVSFPGVAEVMHVFELRYRLMIRRVLEGDRIFGIVGRADGGFSSLGTLVRIERFEFARDGRIFIQVIGLSRFRVLEHSSRDGYVEAKIQPVHDISIAEEEEMEAAETGGGEDASLPSLASSAQPVSKEEIDCTPTKVLMDLCLAYVEDIRERGLYFLTTRVRALYEMRPPDPAAFAWWFASILPVKDSWKTQLLSITSVRERLKLCWQLILEWEGHAWW